MVPCGNASSAERFGWPGMATGRAIPLGRTYACPQALLRRFSKKRPAPEGQTGNDDQSAIDRKGIKVILLRRKQKKFQ